MYGGITEDPTFPTEHERVCVFEKISGEGVWATVLERSEVRWLNEL